MLAMKKIQHCVEGLGVADYAVEHPLATTSRKKQCRLSTLGGRW